MGNFESELRDMFDGVEFQPSEKVWAGVEKALNEKKKKGIFFMWQTYGIAAAIALFITAGMLYKNGFFTDQPTPVKGTQQLSEIESEQKISTDTLKQEDGLNDQLLAGRASDSGKSESIDRSDAETDLLADHTIQNKKDELKQINLAGREQVLKPSVRAFSASKDVGENSIDELVESVILIDLERAQIKPYQASLAAAKAKWLNRLGVDESALAAMIKVAEAEPKFSGENAFNGRLGNNNFNISDPTSSSPLTARAEDANFQALSNIENRQEETQGSISAGLGFSLDLSERLKLNTSLRYSELRVKTTSNAYSVENGLSYPIYLPLGYDPDNVNFVGTYDLINRLQGLSLQPTLSYKVAKFGKFDVSLLGGIGLDYFFSYEIKGDLNFLSIKKADLNDSDYIKNFNLSTITGLGVNYRLNKQFGISADLNYRYFLPGGGGLEKRQSSVLGFGLGVNYFLQKKD